jgi:hypothetical protein
MAQGRMLQKRISVSNKLASLSNDTARLLYTWMLSHLDVNGNFYADPVMVNNIVFTRLKKSINIISAALDEMAARELIIRYQINGEIYLNYPDFHEKQPKLNPYKEGTPDIPIMTEESRITNASVTQAQEKRSKEKRREDKTTEKRQEPKEGFEEFWKLYPRKVNRAEAIQAWNKAILPSLEFILKAIEKQKKSDQWNTDNGKYIPYPSSWLNKERWNDELPTGGNNDGAGSYRRPGATFTKEGRSADGIRGPKEYIPEPPPIISEEQRKENIARIEGIIGKIG